jgi:ABC-type nitrate/sulfonate/bicarbonate transport system substrate-binding protein
MAISSKDWIASHPAVLERFVKSLSQAEDFLVHHEAEAKAIVERRLGLDDASLAALWPQYVFSLSLDQTMIIAMEDEARWMMGAGLAETRPMPNYLDFIYIDALKSVKPSAVTIPGK